MEKVIYCRDVGFDCEGVIRAKNEKEAIEAASHHAKTVHGVKDITPEIITKIKSVIRHE